MKISTYAHEFTSIDSETVRMTIMIDGYLYVYVYGAIGYTTALVELVFINN